MSFREGVVLILAIFSVLVALSFFFRDQLSWNGGAMQDAREGDWGVFFVIAKVHLQ